MADSAAASPSLNGRVAIITGTGKGLGRAYALDLTARGGAPFAQMLDTAYGGTRHTSAMRLLRQRIDDPDLTPSAQVLEAARAHGGYVKSTMFASEHHKQSLLAQPLDAQTQARFEAVAAEWLLAQQREEEQDTGSFEDFVAAYYAC
ncbi:MAG: hypothetical protein ABI343_17130 [Burkholderiaceae bacterium]